METEKRRKGGAWCLTHHGATHVYQAQLGPGTIKFWHVLLSLRLLRGAVPLGAIRHAGKYHDPLWFPRAVTGRDIRACGAGSLNPGVFYSWYLDIRTVLIGVTWHLLNGAVAPHRSRRSAATAELVYITWPVYPKGMRTYSLARWTYVCRMEHHDIGALASHAGAIVLIRSRAE